MRRQNGKTANLGPNLPPEGVWLWGAFCALDDTRDAGMGLGAITYTEMVHYAALWGFTWAPAELSIIRALDRAYRTFKYEQRKTGEGSHGS